MPATDSSRPAAHVSRVQAMVTQVLLGTMEPEELFWGSLSLLGLQGTQDTFLDLIEPLAQEHALSQDQEAKEDEALALALALSLQDAGAGKQMTTEESSGSRSQDVKCTRTLWLEANASAGPRDGWSSRKSNSMSERANSCSLLPCTDNKNVPEEVTASCPGRAKSSRRKRRSGKQQLAISRFPSFLKPILLWFRRDLRVSDNPVLIASLEMGVPIIPVFLWCPKEEEGPGITVATGGASKYWLHHALLCLNQSLEKLGSHLVTVEAETSSLEALQGLAAETGASGVVAAALYEPWLKERDEAVFSALESKGVKCQLRHSYCLREPSSISTEGVGLRGIGSVSHFLSCCQQNSKSALGTPVETPPGLPVPSTWPQGCPLAQLGLAKMPRRKDGTTVDWAANIRSSWDFSEEGAQARLRAFLLDGIHRYEKESCRADAPNTSCLSPYLHFGQISPRLLLWASRSATCRPPKFRRKLAWRDLAYWQLCLFPDLPWQSLRPAYRALRWSSDRTHLKAWQKGRTGYPLVDAAMRQLWLTGWMNNYMRHVVASFLIAYLHLPWQEGYRWFQDTLVDADVAIDAMMWQNGGMCGLDHWNFVMHPVSAGLTCDPRGTFARRWCPELAALPDELVHRPWKSPASMLRRAGVTLGVNYPERIITDLEERRAQSLRDVVRVRRNFPQYVDQLSGCDLVPLPQRLVQEALGSGEVADRGGRFLLPLITRMEFKYQTQNPDCRDNPFDAVLKGYVSRKRDEATAFRNERDFAASVLSESVQRRERQEREQRALDGIPRPATGRPGRTPRKDVFSAQGAGFTLLHN
uniref:Si:ch1073-390k14.1 n=1 Tax=Scleropages formosus TaxID=113540 RepID=A0A8C9S5R5_SCLFO